MTTAQTVRTRWRRRGIILRRVPLVAFGAGVGKADSDAERRYICLSQWLTMIEASSECKEWK